MDNQDLKNIFIECLEELEREYPSEENRFFTERDIVWTVQKNLMKKMKANPDFKVFSDYPVLSKKNRSQSADIAILEKKFMNKDDRHEGIRLVAEFKYEPDKERKYNIEKKTGDIPKDKIEGGVTSSGLIVEDDDKLNEILKKHAGIIGFFVFVDEGRKYSDNIVNYKPRKEGKKGGKVIFDDKCKGKRIKYKIFLE